MIDYDTPGWRITLQVFEGPLDLLLYLIRKNEVDIYDIEIEKITDQYLAYLSHLEEMDLEVAGEFLVVASTLIYIKSRSLLAVEQQMPEYDEADENDPRWDLIRQLVEYKKFKDAAENLEQKALVQEKMMPRDPDPAFKAQAVTGLGNVQVIDLIKAFEKIIERAREKEEFREVFDDKFTVSEKIQHIRKLIRIEGRVMFSTLFSQISIRGEIVVTFLALLELIRLKQLTVFQEGSFSDIVIEGIQKSE
ncbi:MAG: segregation/condensation protein A [Verrucomicrobiota bacterium]